MEKSKAQIVFEKYAGFWDATKSIGKAIKGAFTKGKNVNDAENLTMLLKKVQK
jgi:inhibitor of KinA sporulation pathway (predicted exonuclease)